MSAITEENDNFLFYKMGNIKMSIQLPVVTGTVIL